MSKRVIWLLVVLGVLITLITTPLGLIVVLAVVGILYKFNRPFLLSIYESLDRFMEKLLASTNKSTEEMIKVPPKVSTEEAATQPTEIVTQPTEIRSANKFCPNCGKEVSSQAVACPGCGHPLQQQSTLGGISPISKEKVSFYALFGLHYYYLGRIGTGILFNITGGGFLIWYFSDLAKIRNGNFVDSQGRKIVK